MSKKILKLWEKLFKVFLKNILKIENGILFSISTVKPWFVAAEMCVRQREDILAPAGLHATCQKRAMGLGQLP